MRKNLKLFVCLAAAGLTATPARAALKVGDAAPPLHISDWIKGKPFDLAKDGAGHVVVLEFWATWCMPCVQMIPDTNELYDTYKGKGLKLVAITDSGQGQTLRVVQDFVNRQGTRMSYPVAYDKTEKTYATYVMGSGAMGIPYSVVIDKQGKIVWMGHPAEPEMRETIRDLLLNRYDAEKARQLAAARAKIAPLMNEFNTAAMRGDWEKALTLTEQVLTLDPTNFDALRFTVAIYLEELDSAPRLRAWAERFMRAHADNADALVSLSPLLLASPDYAKRQPDLAVRAAQAAAQVGGNNARVLQGVAEVYFQIGDTESALALQKRAVAAASDLERDGAQARLTYYQTCKKLHRAAAEG